MQPLHGMTASSSKTPKGVLRRMQRVRSDDFNGDGDENIYHHQHHSHHDGEQKSPSPIGAGLPLLSRLRLLKEKQVRIKSNLFFFLLLLRFNSPPIVFLIYLL